MFDQPSWKVFRKFDIRTNRTLDKARQIWLIWESLIQFQISFLSFTTLYWFQIVKVISKLRVTSEITINYTTDWYSNNTYRVYTKLVERHRENIVLVFQFKEAVVVQNRDL